MAIENKTFAHLPEDLSDLESVRNLLQLIIQQINKIIGNSVTNPEYTYEKVEPSAGYVQSEAVQVADDLNDLYKRVVDIEAKLEQV